MEIFPQDLTQAALGARERLSGYAAATARTNVNGLQGGLSPATIQAGAARAAIFADALLQAMHARLEAFKTVSKS